MELRYKKREADLESVAERARKALEDERVQFNKSLAAKNKQIEKFRQELDDLLDAMLELQDQTQRRSMKPPHSIFFILSLLILLSKNQEKLLLIV